MLYAECGESVEREKNDKLWKIAIEFDHTLSCCWMRVELCWFFLYIYIICGREMWWRSIFSLIHTHIESVCMISRLEMIYEHVAIKERYSLRQWKLLFDFNTFHFFLFYFFPSSRVIVWLNKPTFSTSIILHLTYCFEYFLETVHLLLQQWSTQNASRKIYILI